MKRAKTFVTHYHSMLQEGQAIYTNYFTLCILELTFSVILSMPEMCKIDKQFV